MNVFAAYPPKFLPISEMQTTGYSHRGERIMAKWVALDTFDRDSQDWQVDNVDSRKGRQPAGAIGTEISFKVLVLGGNAVGKSALVNRYVDNHPFEENSRATIGVDVSNTAVRKSNTCLVKLQLWDISAGERFGQLRRAAYNDTCGCLVVIDVTRKSSLDSAIWWKQDLDTKSVLSNSSPVPCLLLANKCDDAAREVTEKQLEEICVEHNFLAWREVSAKTGTMVEKSMKFLIEEMIERSGNLDCWRVVTAHSPPPRGRRRLQ